MPNYRKVTVITTNDLAPNKIVYRKVISAGWESRPDRLKIRVSLAPYGEEPTQESTRYITYPAGIILNMWDDPWEIEDDEEPEDDTEFEN